mmetsp:Transcript_10231/g.20020  ORF Transcript_10231/g.20020 Transcript_10231/m.20020 type:complete len:121 (+) Transcript_10231:441-803(+)
MVLYVVSTTASGVYWGWNGGAKTVAYLKVSSDPNERGLVGAGGAGGDIFENEPSGAVQDEEKAKRLWELSAKAVGLPYDSRFSKHFVHPCDTASSSSELWLSACDQRHRRSPRNCCGNRS